ncbi:hypothetical protein CARUB_v10003157mg [Capsella rubella]|uniref:Uncharacterized protein n=1 Tax=Capsella rubella TaxID=81985 RepID=R0FJC9_9BRAS|nr:uncharacterized protein LOC17883740 [Capsella rubella]EOA22502.1 hypothetical protein CARUB_v10003157mg [Capsella rubella]
MKKTILKLTTLVLGVFFIIYLFLQEPRGGSKDGDLSMSMGRKLRAVEPIETKNEARTLEDSSTDQLEREVDHLMRHEYPSPVKPRKRTPVHNGLPYGH